MKTQDEWLNCQCENCAKRFHQTKSRIKEGKGRWCSRACQYATTRRERQCMACGVAFSIVRARANDGRGKYCSKSCQINVRNQQIPEPREQMIARFWGRVIKTDICWLYGANSTHHKAFYRRPADGGSIGAHVFSYELHHGPLPAGCLVRHKCDVGVCVRPDHLLPGTHKENSQDMVERERTGIRKTKLTPQQVIDIRARYNAGEKQRDLGAEFGVSQGCIWHAVNHKNWKLVPDKAKKPRTHIKLTAEKAREIRQKYQAGGITQKELAAEYGVKTPTISSVVNGYKWRDV